MQCLEDSKRKRRLRAGMKHCRVLLVAGLLLVSGSVAAIITQTERTQPDDQKIATLHGSWVVIRGSSRATNPPQNSGDLGRPGGTAASAAGTQGGSDAFFVRLEYHNAGENSHKFWELRVRMGRAYRRWGRIEGYGRPATQQSKPYTHTSDAEAMEVHIAETLRKVNRGYVVTRGTLEIGGDYPC